MQQVWMLLQDVPHACWVVSDQGEIGAGRLIWGRAALFPVSQGADRNAVSTCEFLLRQAERPAQNLGPRAEGQTREILWSERLIIRIIEGPLLDFLGTHLGQRMYKQYPCASVDRGGHSKALHLGTAFRLGFACSRDLAHIA